MRRFQVFLSVCFLFVNSFTFAEGLNNYVFRNGTCQFHAIGNPSFIKIHGVGAVVSGFALLEGESKLEMMEASIDVRKFTTDIQQRDIHMHTKYLESKMYPGAILTMKNQSFPGNKLPEKWKGTGSLKLHGKTKKEVEIEFRFKKKKDFVEVHAEFEISLEDFGIEIPSYLGITVAKVVKIEVDLEATSTNN